MAWRIDESVIRGEIDNRVPGRVTGRIWFMGRAAPVDLDLVGNAWRDLAGRRLEFTNPSPKAADLSGFAALQSGVIGDCTASRKVRVPDIPMDQIGEYYAAKKPIPWHLGNGLYLEWFSAANGRVVIESASFFLTIAPDIAWEMSPEEEESQRRANAAAMNDFMGKLGEALAHERGGDIEASDEDNEVDWDDEKPLTEEEAERMQAESDRLADRIEARMNREGPGADYERILDEELERQRRERGETPLTPEEEAERAEWIEELNRQAEDALKNPDPELEAEIQTKHPVAERAFELAVRLTQDTKVRGWTPEKASREHPVIELVASTMSAAAKCAGALNGFRWPPEADFCAQKIVRLKRARGHLDDALLAAEDCGQQKLVEAEWLCEAQGELHALAKECDRLIGELRALLERGFD